MSQPLHQELSSFPTDGQNNSKTQMQHIYLFAAYDYVRPVNNNASGASPNNKQSLFKLVGEGWVSFGLVWFRFDLCKYVETKPCVCTVWRMCNSVVDGCSVLLCW